MDVYGQRAFRFTAPQGHEPSATGAAERTDERITTRNIRIPIDGRRFWRRRSTGERYCRGAEAPPGVVSFLALAAGSIYTIWSAHNNHCAVVSTREPHN